MVKHHKKEKSENIKIEYPIVPIIITIAILAMLIIFLSYNYFVKPNNYNIENKYYGFQLQAPKGWITKENTLYSEENIAQVLSDNKSAGQQVGAFIVENQKYPDNFSDSTLNNVPSNIQSGAVLEIAVFSASGGSKIAGENTIVHGNYQYNIKKYIYISPSDKNNENMLRQKYTETLNKIISSLKFSK